jgi:hypothetical protein
MPFTLNERRVAASHTYEGWEVMGSIVARREEKALG